jgi:hypothetical protein
MSDIAQHRRDYKTFLRPAPRKVKPLPAVIPKHIDIALDFAYRVEQLKPDLAGPRFLPEAEDVLITTAKTGCDLQCYAKAILEKLLLQFGWKPTGTYIYDPTSSEYFWASLDSTVLTIHHKRWVDANRHSLDINPQTGNPREPCPHGECRDANTCERSSCFDYSFEME